MANDRLINSTQGESIITGLNAIATKLDALKPISAADNGKVVVNGELTAQTAYPTAVTENDTYDTTNYNSITVNVSGGGGAGGSDVIFYDYDGTVVASYSAADFANLSAMPANPTHTGLTAQGWNWSLADAKTYVAANGKLNIGQMYTTSDGKTRLYFTVTKGSLSVELHLELDDDTELDIDWGDGSAHTSWKTSDSDSSKSHNYTDAGRYVIAIDVVSGGFSFGTDQIKNLFKVEIGSGITNFGNKGFYDCDSLACISLPNSVEYIGSFQNCYSLSSITIPDGVTIIQGNCFENCYSLSSITIPDGVTGIGSYCFENCYSLSSITIPDGFTIIQGNCFENCYSLSSVTIPDGVTGIGNYAFNNCYSLSSITIPDGVTEIGESAFSNCYPLSSITIPDGVTGIGNGAFSSCYPLSSITIPDGVTGIGGYAFSGCYSLQDITFLSSTPPDLLDELGINYSCIIHVPQGSLSAYTSASYYPDPSQYIYEEY